MRNPLTSTDGVRSSAAVGSPLSPEVATILQVTFVPIPVVRTIERMVAVAAPAPTAAPAGHATPGFADAGPSDRTRMQQAPATAAAPPAVPADAGAAAPARVVITEILYNPELPGIDAPFEWIELYNDGSDPVNLAGWSVEDDGSRDLLPAFTLGAGRFVIVAASASFAELYPDYDGPLVLIEDGVLGDGLANGGDRLVLRDRTGRDVDGVSWGWDRTFLDPPAPATKGGWSIERRGPDYDAEFVANERPSPGVPFEPRVAAGSRQAATQDEGAPARRKQDIEAAPALALLLGLPLLFAAHAGRNRR
jgi:hypothetical protein